MSTRPRFQLSDVIGRGASTSAPRWVRLDGGRIADAEPDPSRWVGRSAGDLPRDVPVKVYLDGLDPREVVS